MNESLLQSVPALNPMFRLQWETAQDCFVLLYPEGMVQLNGPAGEILSRVNGLHSLQTIIDELCDKFPGAEDLSEDVIEFIKEAHEHNWITL